MAAVSQTIAPVALLQVFSGLPRSANTIYPRARVVFNNATTITLKAAGNTNTVIYNFDLPPNYAYRFDQSYVAFSNSASTEVSQFDDLGVASLSLNGGANQLARMYLESKGLTSSGTVTGGLKAWSLMEVYGEVFQALASSFCRVSYELFDDHADETVAQGVQVHVSFLQYDVDQVLNVGVNAPQPVNVV